MTVLVGASMLLIGVSAIFLVFGWVGASQPLIWASIAATVTSAVTLTLAFLRSRSEPAAGTAVSGGGEAPAPSSSGGEVIGVKSTGKYHRPDCRYAGSRGAERMSVEDARSAGLSACGICTP
ncbi:MAG: hypothetical protein ABR579_01595 [Actinomycetota bacterium]